MNTYYDNATTSYPKPSAMREALAHFYDEPVGSYGRSHDRATLRVVAEIEELRDVVASLLGVAEPSHICFCDNATTGLNAILRGVLQEGDTVLVSPMEHNAVMRPLHFLSETRGVRVEVMPALPDGRVDTQRLAAAIPTACALAVVNLQSNVNGIIQPIAEISRILKQRGVRILADATQCLGSMRLQTDAWSIDYLAFTGHKGLLGPSGTGGFYMRRPLDVSPLTLGGNGLHSSLLSMGTEMPERFMAGTANVLGLTALLAAVRHLPSYRLSHDEWQDYLLRMRELSGLRVYSSSDGTAQGFLCSLTHERLSPAELSDALYHGHGIITRAGLHCAPLAHETIGTAATGTTRISLSPYHTAKDLDHLLDALRDVVRR